MTNTTAQTKPLGSNLTVSLGRRAPVVDPFATHPCSWLVERVRETEDGQETLVVECGAPAVETHGGRGFRCEAGHEHLPIEIEFEPFGPAWQREQSAR